MNKKTPRIAFIIQCHKNPQQINLLIESLQRIYDCHIFLHLDKKNYSICQWIQLHNVTLIPEEKSVDVRWGQFSQCQATLTLINTVFNSYKTFDYIWLLSGQDLPIAGTEQAACFLSDEPVPFIEVMGKEHPLFSSFAKRNDVYYINCLLKRNILCRLLLRGYRFITGGRKHTWAILKRRFEIPYYFGSSWWCLPYSCVKEMIDILNQSDYISRYFLHSSNADESLFQTLFMQTSYAGCQRPILTYIDWSEGRSSPRTFRCRDIPTLKKIRYDYLLARKFDLTKDEEICQSVLEEFCGLHP